MTSLKILDEEDKRNELKKDCYSFSKMHRGLCVLEKQQRVPISMLGCLWSIEGEYATSSMSRVREICEKFVRVGLAEWNHTTRNRRINNQLNNNHNDDSFMECISIHDLLHDFALNEAKKKGEIEEWHDRILKGYKRRHNVNMNENAECEEWWKIEELNEDRDGYFFKNLCRHMRSIKNRRMEIVKLVTRPEWIATQVCTNGIIQYGEDINYARECIDANTEEIQMQGDDKVSILDMEWIHNAVRLSAIYIQRNKEEILFQLYDRLIRKAIGSTWLKNYLLYIEKSTPKPWMKLLQSCLSGAGSNSISLGRKYISCMVVLKGEEEVACGCGDGYIFIVNIKNRYIKKSWNAHDEGIKDIKVSDNGKFLISGSYDKTVKVWYVKTFELKRILKGHTERVRAVWFGSGGNTAFTGSEDGMIRRWDVETGKKMGEYCSDGERIDYLAALEDGNLIIFTALMEKKMYGVRMESEEDKRSIGSPWKSKFNKSTEKIFRIKNGITAFAVSDDETKVAIGTQERKIIVFNTATVKEIQTIHLSDSIHGWTNSIAWSSDATRLACGPNRREISIIDVNSENMICESLKTEFDGTTLDFIDGGNKVVLCSGEGMIKSWNVGEISSQALSSDHNRQNCNSLAITPDGSHFVTGHKHRILRKWDVATASLKQSEQVCDSMISAVIVSPDSTRIFCGCDDGTVQVVDKTTLRRITSFKGHNDAIFCTGVSVDGNSLVTGSWDETILIWDANKCDGSQTTIRIGSHVIQVFICKDGKRIVCIIYDDDYLNHKIQVWDIKKKQCIREKKINNRPKSRNEAMILIDEVEEDEMADYKTVFCLNSKRLSRSPSGNEIRYGLFDNYEVLGTLEFDIRQWEYDMKHQLLCVLDEKDVLFFKVEAELEN